MLLQAEQIFISTVNFLYYSYYWFAEVSNFGAKLLFSCLWTSWQTRNQDFQYLKKNTSTQAFNISQVYLPLPALHYLQAVLFL